VLLSDRVLSLDHVSRAEIIQVIKSEWIPDYKVNDYCGHCVAEMIKMAFRNMDNETERVKIKL
jgi:hypothetical protein